MQMNDMKCFLCIGETCFCGEYGW